MRPWLKNKPQNQAENEKKDKIKDLIDIAQQVKQERSSNPKSRQSLIGELVYDKIQEAHLKLVDIQSTSKNQEDIQDYFSSYIAYLINLYVNVKEDLLEQQFVQNLMFQKMKINWKSSKFFTIVDENNEFLVFENKISADENKIAIINKDGSKNFELKLNKQGEESKYKIQIEKALNAQYEIHRYLQKHLSINQNLYTKYEVFDNKIQQKYNMIIIPFNESSSSSRNSIISYLYHIYLYTKYPQNISPIDEKIIQLDDKKQFSRLVFLIKKPQCTLFDIIKERNVSKQQFSQAQMKKIFQQLITFMIELKKKENICINDFSVDNIGYYKSTDSYGVISLDLLTLEEQELVGKIHLLPKQYYQNYTENETKKFDHLHNSMYQLATVLLQVYNLKEIVYETSEIESFIKQLEDQEKQNSNDDFLKVIHSLFQYNIESTQSNLEILLTNTLSEVNQNESNSDQEQNKDEIQDADISKKVQEKQKKKKKPTTLQETLQIASGYYDLKDAEKSIKTYKEFIEKSQNNSSTKPQQTDSQRDIILALMEISQIYLSQENINEANTHIKQAAQVCIQHQLLDDLKMVAQDWNDISIKYQEKGLLKEQIQILNEILTILEQNLSQKQDPSSMNNSFQLFSNALKMLSEAYKNVGDYEAAYKQTMRAFDIDSKVNDKNSIQMAISLNQLGTIQLLKGMFNESIQNLEKSIKILKENLQKNDPQIARGLNDLGEAYRGLGNDKKALSTFEEALKIFKEINLEESLEDNIYQINKVATTLNNIGIIYYQSGEHTKGIDSLEKSLKIEKKLIGENQQNAQTMFNMMIMLQKVNRLEEAVEYGSSAYRFFLNMYPQGHPTLVQCQQVLNFLSSKLNKEN